MRFRKLGLSLCAIVAISVVPNKVDAISVCDGVPCYDLVNIEHSVRPSETLWSISRLYYGGVAAVYGAGTDHEVRVHYPTRIAKVNGIDTSNLIRPGQKLVIPRYPRVRQ